MSKTQTSRSNFSTLILLAAHCGCVYGVLWFVMMKWGVSFVGDGLEMDGLGAGAGLELEVAPHFAIDTHQPAERRLREGR